MNLLRIQKPYTSSSLPSAISQVRSLRRALDRLETRCWKLASDRVELAKLAADGQCFTSALEEMAATSLRDQILKSHGLAPDGTPLSSAAGGQP